MLPDIPETEEGVFAMPWFVYYAFSFVPHKIAHDETLSG